MSFRCPYLWNKVVAYTSDYKNDVNEAVRINFHEISVKNTNSEFFHSHSECSLLRNITSYTKSLTHCTIKFKRLVFRFDAILLNCSSLFI